MLPSLNTKTDLKEQYLFTKVSIDLRVTSALCFFNLQFTVHEKRRYFYKDKMAIRIVFSMLVNYKNKIVTGFFSSLMKSSCDNGNLIWQQESFKLQ